MSSTAKGCLIAFGIVAGLSFAFLLFLYIVGSCARSATETTETTSTTIRSSEQASIEKHIEESTYKEAQEGNKENPYLINEEVRVKDVAWKILEAENLGDTLRDPSGFLKDKKTSGNFILVKFAVKNMGSDMKTITGLELVDSKDREFTSYSEAFGYINENEELFILDNINPGITKEYTAVYEVPEDAAGLLLEVTDLTFLADLKYIDLGLD